jgi:hypothetical protein
MLSAVAGSGYSPSLPPKGSARRGVFVIVGLQIFILKVPGGLPGARFGPPVPERRVLLEKMDPNAFGVGRPVVPRAPLIGSGDGPPAQRAELRGGNDPGHLSGTFFRRHQRGRPVSAPRAHQAICPDPLRSTVGRADRTFRLGEWKRLRRDHLHGATWISRRVLDLLPPALRAASRKTPSQRRSDLLRCSRLVRQTLPALGALQRWSEDLCELATDTSAPGRFSRRWQSWWTKQKVQLEREIPLLVRHAPRIPFPRGPALTISRSETVLRVLQHPAVQKRVRFVWALESRPGGEGETMARDLRQKGVPSAMIPDRWAPEAMRTCQSVLISADAVFPDGRVVHKVGTRRLASLAYREGRPVFVLAGRSRWAPGPKGDWEPPRLFDVTPTQWITGYWTDAGRWSPPESPN